MRPPAPRVSGMIRDSGGPAPTATTTTTTTTDLSVKLIDDGQLLVPEEKKGAVYWACICCYTAKRPCICGWEGASQCCCCLSTWCCALNPTPTACGCIDKTSNDGQYKDIWFGWGC
eukprot:SAG31_NODE_25525_length_459_cov_1.688889_1_plen_115_part_10